MATKPTHTTMQNTAAIPAARHTDPAGSRRRQRSSQRCRGEQRVFRDVNRERVGADRRH
jgi:hypothetical protein